MARNQQQFTTIRTEGALLPPDILQRISAEKAEGMRPADYHLPEGFKTTEATTQSWEILKKHWKTFQEAREQLSDSDTGTAVTNARWLLPLFKELEFGRLTTVSSPDIDDRNYPIERFYNKTPIHLIGCNLTLDRRTKGARGAATASPHSMVQEFLNRSDDHLWAFLSNGLQLRILRDNISLSRQAFVEFDLEGMMEGEIYSDFVLLWMLCHQSRVEAEKSEECWLEKWSKLARDEGTRVLNGLRTGVAEAIEALGRGFIAHPRNDDLRRKLQESGTLTKDDFYRQLLRVVYRLLFLFVAEDRQLLHATDADENACDLYDKYYSTSRLREMSLKLRGSKHGDLWHSLSLVFSALGQNDGCPQLGLVGLGSFLWDTNSTADLAGPREVTGDAIPVEIANDDLLTAIRALAFIEQDKVLRSVDYRNLGSEELGSVYESLLELHPDMHIEARQFELRTAAGNERKTTGSYYTPDSLVQCLLDSALEPVVADRLKGKKGADAEAALLSMTVCDPACGSGHFLISAAHRLARHLARVRTGDAEASPEDYQHSLRDIIGRCIYGVDINPMAVELCKVSLWMEAIEPGKPLSFLDHHIQCGNSLLGTTPRLLAEGIPDSAFKAIEGDDKKYVAELKKENKKLRQDFAAGQKGFAFEPFIKLGNLPAELTRLSNAADESVADVTEKQRRYAELVSGADYQNARLLADAWCAVFVWKKDRSDIGKLCPLERDFRKIENNPHDTLPHVKAEVRRLAEQYQFFHWHLAFPDVFRQQEEGKAENERTGWNAGFDVVLGNPPWERIKLQEKEFFSERAPEIADAKTAASRRKKISALSEQDPVLFAEFKDARRFAEAVTHLIRHSDRYPLTSVGDINTYAIFTGLARSIYSRSGGTGLIVPTGIATDDQLKRFFEDIIAQQELVSLIGFENEEFLFPGVANVVRFCIMHLSLNCLHGSNGANFGFFIRRISQLSEHERFFNLTADDIGLLNPNTRTCPIFRSQADAELTKSLYRRFPVFINEGTGQNDWGAVLATMFHMTNDSNVFRQSDDGDVLPLYEGKLFWHFDHRFASFDLVGTAKGKGGRGLPHQLLANYQNPDYRMTPQHWVERCHVDAKIPDAWNRRWFITFRDVTSAKLERTAVFAVIPYSAVGNKAPLVFLNGAPSAKHIACFVANVNSLVFDFIVRQKIGGASLNFFIVKQLPVVPPERYQSSDLEFIVPRVIELVYTSNDIRDFAADMDYSGAPYPWDADRRATIRAELDAYFAYLYGLTREDLEYILDPSTVHGGNYQSETFRVLKEKETAQFGEFRTRLMVLDAWDKIHAAEVETQ